tara:strand:+ start:2546 stop:4288 length:1743 start_codon:yes stop_codon:yes gene_type:complete
MILKSFKSLLGLLILFLASTSLSGEEKIDIWKKNKSNKSVEADNKTIKQNNKNKIILGNSQKIESDEIILIEKNSLIENDKAKIFGIYDPAEYNFNLNMWSSTSAEDVRSSIKRLKKINLSKTSNEILENILLSFSYPPNGMKEDEFVNIKINWLIENNRSDLIENFLKQNNEFKNKSKVVQFLVDENIAQANIKQGCEKIKFIDKSIKDSYLEKFKIYCLSFNNKDSQALLLLDLLREQNQSDKFFDDKINFLLGISDKTSNKINDKNLLNFYLSSVTIKDFKYEPTSKTKKEIWKYLNAANLIKIENFNDKNKLKELEQAVNKGQVDDNIIFNIYQNIPFNLNTLINAQNLYQTLDETDARALIYQKYLLSESVKSKVNYLFMLEELFKKENIYNVYSRLLSRELRRIGVDNMPEEYQEIASNRIKATEETQLGKIKYNDKILHQSKIIKFYIDNEDEKKIQKEINKVFKKISKNKKYFYSAKDLALVHALIKDGFDIPSNFNYKEKSSKYDIPSNLLQLVKKKQNAFLALKIIEIMGEDEPYQLDPETIFFITSLLNEMDLIKIRNKVLISALPERV